MLSRGISYVIRCRPFYPALLGALLLFASPGNAEQLGLMSETILRGFERERPDGSTARSAPIYEYLRLDYSTKKIPGLSLHLDGWGRLNLADNYNQDTTDARILYAYLRYAPPKQNYQIIAGRQYLFEGVTRDNLDGISGKLLVLPRTTVAAYAGVPTAFDDRTGRRGDLIYGGKLTYNSPGRYDLGLSYKHLLDNGARREHLVGGDLAANFPFNVTLLGHSTWDLISSSWSEHSYELRLPVGPVTFQPFLQRFRYASYFSNRRTGVPPFRFLEGSGNTITTAGADIFLYPSDRSEFAFRFKNYDYRDRFKPSQYYSLIATRRFDILSEIGAEIGRMQGSQLRNRYLLTRLYAFWKFAPGFVTGDVTYVLYDRSIYGRHSSLFTSVGVGTGFLKDTLNVKLSVDYSNDPYFDADYRFMVKLNYLLDRSFGLPGATGTASGAAGGGKP